MSLSWCVWISSTSTTSSPTHPTQISKSLCRQWLDEARSTFLTNYSDHFTKIKKNCFAIFVRSKLYTPLIDSPLITFTSWCWGRRTYRKIAWKISVINTRRILFRKALSSTIHSIYLSSKVLRRQPVWSWNLLCKSLALRNTSMLSTIAARSKTC